MKQMKMFFSYSRKEKQLDDNQNYWTTEVLHILESEKA